MNSIPKEILAAAELISDWATENNVTSFAIHGIQHRLPSTEPGVFCEQLVTESPIESVLPPDYDTKSS